MSKGFVDLKDEMNEMQFDLNFLQKIDCSKKENKEYLNAVQNGKTLPDGVFQYCDVNSGEKIKAFYTVADSGLTNEEKRMFIEYKKLMHIKAIKYWIIFFTIIMIAIFITTLIILNRLPKLM